MVTDERRVEGGEVITGDVDMNMEVLLLVVHPPEGQLHVGRVLCCIHQRRVHHLIVYCVLGICPAPQVKIVDEEATLLSLLDDIRPPPCTAA